MTLQGLDRSDSKLRSCLTFIDISWQSQHADAVEDVSSTVIDWPACRPGRAPFVGRVPLLVCCAQILVSLLASERNITISFDGLRIRTRPEGARTQYNLCGTGLGPSKKSACGRHGQAANLDLAQSKEWRRAGDSINKRKC